jgi:hypothetical protein
MPAATNLEELLDFEGQFERAAQAILVAVGISAYIDQQKLKLPLLNAGVMFDVGPATEALQQIPKPASWPAGLAAPQEFFQYDGQLEFRVECGRDVNSTITPDVDTALSAARAKIRANFMLSVNPFNSTVLPFYRVSTIRPMGTSSGFEPVRNVDFTSLRFALRWVIDPACYPAWIEV